ncbi:putative oxidoreductase [Periconia macrospinosa]|uniref:Putative oxidoreductase n=1 Tax=Periconia macrospinosa TaxID=97972 RepID=A0A2V1DII8_9PLEO|nr:putative oxidoreductase [Periconia macrospinosa]
MPTPTHFSRYPVFPSDTSFPVADIPTISLTKLQAGSTEESSRLYEACRKEGFLFVDLSESRQGQTLLQYGGKMFDLIENTLTLDQSTLEKYACDAPRSLIGYKRKGILKVDDSTRDCIEVYTLSQDDILGNIPPLSNPAPIESNRHDCRGFFESAFTVVNVLLGHLDRQLDLQPGTLEARCALDKPSATSLRMLLSPAQPEDRRINLGGHTDIGLITLLFNVTGGLQVLPAGSENIDENWRYIKPQPGCALINIGDTLTEWAGGLLRSSLHRVVSPPGPQAQLPRQSLVYLVRPEKGATMQRLKGGSVIPPLGDEEDDTRDVDSWAVWRAQQVMDGVLKPESRGGK